MEESKSADADALPIIGEIKPPSSPTVMQEKITSPTDPIESPENVNSTNKEQEIPTTGIIHNDDENLLEPTDFVPDNSDIIEDQKRKFQSTASDRNKQSKKLKRGAPYYDDDGTIISGSGGNPDESNDDDYDDDFDEDDDLDENSMRFDDTQFNKDSNIDEFREKHYESDVDESHDYLSDTDANNAEILEKPEESETLNLTEILAQGINADKTIEIADIIENPDELLNKSVIDDKTDDIANFKQESTASNDTKDELIDNETDVNRMAIDDEMDFDLTEKLKDMGEISLGPVSKSERKSVSDFNLSDEVSLEITKKSGSDCSTEDKRKISNLRKNIREVMDDNQLDASTLAAQREELERLARVQDQQRMIREMQRQIQLDRQNSKTQNRVLSLLQGHTSLLKSSANSGASSSKVQQLTSPSNSTTLVKITGTNKDAIKIEDALSGESALTPSVSIAPIKISQQTPTETIADELELPIEVTEDDEIEQHAVLDIHKKDEIEPNIPAESDDDDDDDVVELKPKKDIVTIEDSSDDDCILLSDEDELPEEGDDDPQNSGLHVNDTYNVPDGEGRVVINIGHPEGEEDIFLAPQIARIIKPHQIGGVRFLFDNIIESVERFSTSTGFGCILAHSMGLGKTLQLCCFCDIFLRHTNSKTILCIMPINTLQNWLAEFNMWLPDDPEKSPLSAQGEVRPRNFKLFVLNDTHKTLNARSKVILDWAKEGGVLLIGYELYRLLSLKKMTKRRGRKTARDPETEEREAEEHKKLLDEMHAALVKPGPDLIVCDEGHRIKNSHASISVALKQIRSKRRIVLTGYPLQNNLLEYWCMVDFVRPNYLGTKTEFANMFERPIQNGQCIDSTPQDIKLMRYRAHVLHSLLLGFVQRRSHVVLQNSLPQKEEYVLLVRMTPFQRKLYDVFMNEVVRTKAVPNPLKAFAVCCKIWNHPDVLYNFLKKREADLDLEEAEAAANDPTYEPPVTSAPATPAKNKKKASPITKKGKKNAKDNGIEAAKIIEIKPAATIPPTTAIPPNTIDANVIKTENEIVVKSELATGANVKTENHDSIKTEQKYFNQNAANQQNKDALPLPSQAQNLNQSPYPGAMHHPNYPPMNNYNMPYNSYNQYDPSGYYNNYGQQQGLYGGSHAGTPPMHNNYYMNQEYGHGHYNQPDFNQPQNSYWPSTHQYYPHHGDYQQNYPNYGSNDYHSNYASNAQNHPQQTNYHSVSSMHNSYSGSASNEWNNSTNNNSNQSNTTSTTNQMNNFNMSSSSSSNSASSNSNLTAGTTNKSASTLNGSNENSTQSSSVPSNATSVQSEPNSIKSEENKSELIDMDTKEIKTETMKKEIEKDDDDKLLIPTTAADLKDDISEKDVKVKDDGIPYDWAVELMKGYTPDLIANSPKMEIFFCILQESIRMGDRMLIFSQSLLTLNLIEKLLQANPSDATGTEIRWAKNTNYYRKFNCISFTYITHINLFFFFKIN